MRLALPLGAVLLPFLSVAASAQEPKTGLVDGDHKGCKYQLAVPPGFKKAEAAKYALYITFPPTAHQAKDYGHLWQSSKGPSPQLSLCLDGATAAIDLPTLLEKVGTEYGYDTNRVYCVCYGEGAIKGFKFVAENADLLAGFIILQPSTSTTEPKAGGKSVPVLIMNDKACTYSPPFQAEALRDKFTGLGYEATLIMTDDPSNKDGWPVKEMSKIYDWTGALVPAKPETVWEEAAAWLAEGAKDTEHRPKLRGAVKKYFGMYGSEMSPGGVKAGDNAVGMSLKDAVPTVKEIKGGLKGQIALVAAAKGKKVEAGSMVLCDSAEFDVIDESLIICSGDVKANKVTKSVILAKGAVTVAKDAMSCVVHAGGHVKIGTTLEDCTILALGGVEAAGKAKNNWFVNTAEVKIKSNEAARMAKRIKLPGGK
ncbi:MAG: hypothetical protein FD180_1976 [Planctomycetota bacterium]|nr:MAG: hypothetical protein FD180_1976 [Planctomycetota bacterium]